MPKKKTNKNIYNNKVESSSNNNIIHNFIINKGTLARLLAI